MWGNLTGIEAVIGWMVIFGMIGLGVAARPRASALPARPSIPQWRIALMHYLFLCWLIVVIIFILSAQLAVPWMREGESDTVLARNAVIMALSLHGPLILLFFALCGSSQGRVFIGDCSASPREPWSLLVRRTVLYLLEAIPLFLLVSFLWQLALIALRMWGIAVNEEPQELIRIMATIDEPLLLVMLVLAAIVLAPLSEEFVFRAVLHRFLVQRMRLVRLSALLSGCVFALIHFNIAAFAPLAVLGYVLARAYDRAADIRVPILMHTFFNLTMSILVILLRGLGL